MGTLGPVGVPGIEHTGNKGCGVGGSEGGDQAAVQKAGTQGVKEGKATTKGTLGGVVVLETRNKCTLG